MLHRSTALLSWLLFGLIAWVVLVLPAPVGLTQAALTELERSGVTNPVTAALLNYRGYDTLLEVAVFLLAVVGVWSVRAGDATDMARQENPTLLALLRLVQPVLILAGGYLLWIGAFAPGGAFQGGAVIGGAAVLALLSGFARAILQPDLAALRSRHRLAGFYSGDSDTDARHRRHTRFSAWRRDSLDVGDRIRGAHLRRLNHGRALLRRPACRRAAQRVTPIAGRD